MLWWDGRGHRFRGRVVVEFGPPIRIPEELIELYKTNRKEAYQQFLSIVEDGMRATLVTAPNYHALHLVYTARRLFQKDNWLPTPSEKMDMNRRFAEGYKMLIQRYGDSLPQEMKTLEGRLMDYQKTLHDLGLRDYQVLPPHRPCRQMLRCYMHINGARVVLSSC